MLSFGLTPCPNPLRRIMQSLYVVLLTSLFTLFTLITAAAGVSTSPLASFGYTGIDGPLGWTRGNDANPKCSTGTNQSPINIDSTIPVTKSHVKLSIPDGRLNFTNNGHTLQVTTGGSLLVGLEKYQLVQFHFHTPAEHLIDDEFFPLEMHLVFQAAGAQPTDPCKVETFLTHTHPTNHEPLVKLVIGVLFEVYSVATMDFLTTLAMDLPKTAGTSVITHELIFEPLIKHIERERLYMYQGSLTTPPCSEGLTWLILEKALRVDVATYRAFKNIIKFNARYIQNTPGDKNLITFAKDNYPTAT
ncbi:hypothetical protein C0995_011359 [Termitomyces sp. Mi166|nr:hypothetical protein C0995_011359 [Termitomyces sp. Mi166\